MPEQFDDFRRPEQLLPGSDRARPLSPGLRARLERSLLGLSESREPTEPPPPPFMLPVPATEPPPAPRPLSPEVRDRLENSLRRPRRARPAQNWKRIIPGAGVAAAVALLAAIVVPQLVTSSGRPGGTLAAKAAGPSVARLGLSPPSTAVSYGLASGKGRGAPGRVPGHSGPARFAPSRSGTTPLVPGPAVPGPVVTGRPATAPVPMAAVAEAPLVSSVSPREGPPGGRNWVVVIGQGFVGVSAVEFGASSAVDFTVESPVELKVRAPAHATGTVDIVVTGPTGRSRTSASDRYTFGR